MNFIGSNKELLLVHPEMKHTFLSHSVNVMLTPQFYTLKKEELPVKYHYQAKKIAPSLFDGLLDDEEHHEYFVYKENEMWVFIAYNVGKIKALLSAKGIKLEQVGKIFFAEQSLDSFSAPVLLGDKEALVKLDDTIVVIPQISLDEEMRTLTIDNSFTPKTGVTLEGASGHESLLNQTQALSIATIFAIFAGMFFMEGWRYGADSHAIEEEMQLLLEEHPSLQSKMQRENIFTKYKTIDTSERKKRELLKTFSGMIFKGVTLTSIVLTEKSFKAQFACNNDKVSKQFVEMVKKENLKSSNVTGSNVIQIEGTL